MANRRSYLLFQLSPTFTWPQIWNVRATWVWQHYHRFATKTNSKTNEDGTIDVQRYRKYIQFILSASSKTHAYRTGQTDCVRVCLCIFRKQHNKYVVEASWAEFSSFFSSSSSSFDSCVFFSFEFSFHSLCVSPATISFAHSHSLIFPPKYSIPLPYSGNASLSI